MKTDSSSPQPSLLRALGPIMATAVVVGTVIGSGVFKKPQVVAANVPYFGLAALVWVLGGLIVLFGSLAYAEVAVLYPKAGGNYVFLREGYGRMAGFLWGWVEFCIIRCASIAALATIFSESLHNVLANPAFQEATGLNLGSRPLDYWSEKALTVAVIAGLALVNVRGVRWGGWLQRLITTVKVGSLLAIIVLPFIAFRLATADANVPRPNSDHLTPFFPDQLSAIDFGAFGAALVGVQWAYHGWMNIAPVAEE